MRPLARTINGLGSHDDCGMKSLIEKTKLFDKRNGQPKDLVTLNNKDYNN